ncbi:hypothetical protein [Kiritimatiella glycovorans]|uniref:Uncharacterized protein n=1 Tax=Kiritimatiella glycovorans TaxID=1307763 RepID=A0A0G3EA70_9BACT|nr:hypothetical protein [Kiritimatiella glycovorans]AKJ63336.1 hypothetical protein L21SP4_00047 [Kiritimatiella glycovorans]
MACPVVGDEARREIPGELSFSAGSVYSRYGRGGGSADEHGIGWIYGAAGYETPAWRGFRAGASGVVLQPLFEDTSLSGAYNDVMERNYGLSALYLEYSIPRSRSMVLSGWSPFKKVEAMDGDVYEGVQFTSRDIPGVEITFEAIDRWQDNLSMSMDADGVDADRRNPAEDVRGADHWVYAIIVEAGQPGTTGLWRPFCIFQRDAYYTAGAEAQYLAPLRGEWSLQLDGIAAVYGEQTPDRVSSTDEDAYSWLLHASLVHEVTAFGIGYYTMSEDERMDAKAVGTYPFDPMEIGPEGGAPGDRTWYADAGVTLGPAEVLFMYGLTEITSSGARYSEFDAYVDVECTEEASLEAYWAVADVHRGLGYDSRTETGLRFSYAF